MYETQPVIPGLEELDPQRVLPFEDELRATVAETDDASLMLELDTLHETINDFDIRGDDIDAEFMALFETLEGEAVARGLMVA